MLDKMKYVCHNQTMNSIREVAKQAGVSAATVSRAFNAPELISPATHKHVLETANRLNYRPLRTKTRKETRTLSPSQVETFIGFQFFSKTAGDLLQANSFYAPILAGAQAEASALGMHLLTNSTDRHQLELELPKMIREQTVGGMLLVGTADPDLLALFLKRVPQIVLVDQPDPTGQHDALITDGFGGTLAATNYLISLGHKKIGFLRDNPDVLTFRDRLRGFVCAHFEAGLPIDPRLMVTTQCEEEVPAALQGLLGTTDRPTAIVAANDSLAYAVMQACRTLRLRVPEDISLVGFDDIAYSAQSWPPLTTVRVEKEQLGRLAVNRLQARLQSAGLPEEMPPITLQIPTSLIVRQSCRPLS